MNIFISILSLIRAKIVIFFIEILNFLSYLLELLSLPIIVISIILFLIIYNIIIYLLKDRNFYQKLINEKDPKNLVLENLKVIPQITIIVPAWKEGKTLQNCLTSITTLTYPKLYTIVNAGGNDETIKIANSFKKYENFKIIYQEGGGKIKALNECIPFISGGVVYLVDADVRFTDEIILRMLYPIVNDSEDVVMSGIRPFTKQEELDLVKYLQINRNPYFRKKFERYHPSSISGANTMLKYHVIKSIGKFTENNIWAEDKSRGMDIMSKGFKIYCLVDYRSRIFSEFPDTIKKWFKQKIRWNINFLTFAYQKRKIDLIKFIFLLLASFVLFIFPFLGVVHLSFLFFSLIFLLSFYLIRIRRFIFFKKVNKQYLRKYKIKFFIKMILYIYIEAFVYIYILFYIIFFKKRIKYLKNLDLKQY